MASSTGPIALKVVEKYCVVCGMGSSRSDWQSSASPVACDSHSKEEVATAVASKTPATKPSSGSEPKPSKGNEPKAPAPPAPAE